MANSAIVYTSINAEWASVVMIMNQDFVDAAIKNDTILTDGAIRDPSWIRGTASRDPDYALQVVVHEQPPLQQIEALGCHEMFAHGTNERWGDVVAVVNVTANVSRIQWLPQHSADDFPPRGLYLWQWLCGALFTSTCVPSTAIHGDEWLMPTFSGPDYVEVTHCLARQMPEACELTASLSIMIAIVACLTAKIVATIAAILLQRDVPLVTIGDAVASFLERPSDVSTLDHKYSGNKWAKEKIQHPNRKRSIAKEISSAWFYQWAFTIIVMSVSAWAFNKLLFVSKSFSKKVSRYQHFQAMLKLGFGEMPLDWNTDDNGAETVMSYAGARDATRSYIASAVIANIPQLVISALYLVTNNFLTRVFTAMEFRSFAMKRRGLRVSTRKEKTNQRAAHFLQLPLRYSLINIALFVLLHTFTSQTLFPRRVYAIWPTSFNDPTAYGKELVSMLGYSPVSGFALMILLASMVLASTMIASLRFDWILPNTTGRTFPMAVLCCPLEGQRAVQEGKVMWGKVGESGAGKEGEEKEVKQCAFSLAFVTRPVVGDMYVGPRRIQGAEQKVVRVGTVPTFADAMGPEAGGGGGLGQGVVPKTDRGAEV